METKDMELINKINSNLDAVAEDVKAMKTKAQTDGTAQEEKMKELKEQIKSALETHSAHSKEMSDLKKKADEIDKAISDLDLRTKGKAFNLGLVDGSFFSKYAKDNAELFAKCAKSEGAAAISMTMKKAEFERMMHLKTAGNMTEAGNLLGDFVIAPDRLPGYYADPLRPIHIREFMSSTATDSNLINYSQETAFTDGSGATAQGSAAAQSDFTLTAKQVIVQKLNTYFTVSKESLEDTPLIESYIRVRGTGRLLMQEDTQLLYGNGSAPNQQGITPIAAAYKNPVIYGATSANINYYDVLHTAVTQARVAYYVPNYILIHPNDYNKLVLSRDTYGRYQFPQMISGQAGTFYINGAQVIANTAVNEGDFLIGDFKQGGLIAIRDEIEITFSNQHVDNFIKGFITVMIEERLGNVIFRPNAFIFGTFNQAIISGS